MTEHKGPFTVVPEPGEPFRLESAVTLASQWPTLLERLPPRAKSFAVHYVGTSVLLGARPVEPLTDDPNVTAMAYDRSGTWVVSGHGDGSVRLWDVESADPIWARDPADEPIDGLAFVEQGPWVLAWCEDGPLLVIARETGELVTRIEDPQFEAFTITVSPRGDEVALTGASVMRIALPGGEMRARLDEQLASDGATVQWVEYLADGATLMGVRASNVADEVDEVVFWNADHGARVGTIATLRAVCACDLSFDRKLAAIATSDGKQTRLHLIDTGLRSIARSIDLPHRGVNDMRFAPDGKTVWVTDLVLGATPVDVASGTVGAPIARDLAGLCVPVEGRIVPDSDESRAIMVTRDRDGTMELTSLEPRGPFGPIGRSISMDGSRYALIDEAVDNNRVLVCETARSAVMATLPHRANVQEIWLAPTGTRIAVRAAGHVYVWNLPPIRSL